MRIDEDRNLIVFENIVSATRDLGSDESITVATPAEKAVACNAKGTFKSRDIFDINDSAKRAGKNLVVLLSS